MSVLDRIAEARIAEALARGELDDLPGTGRPIPPEPENPFIPEELRVAYRVLKNAGYLPAEVRLRRDIEQAEQLLLQAQTQEQRVRATSRLRLLLTHLGTVRAVSLQTQQAYYERLVARIEGGPNAHE